MHRVIYLFLNKMEQVYLSFLYPAVPELLWPEEMAMEVLQISCQLPRESSWMQPEIFTYVILIMAGYKNGHRELQMESL
ncbi:hypothetical protein D3C85_1779300 [compost metagenome]